MILKFSILFLILFSLQTIAQGKVDGFYKGDGNLNTVLGFGFEDSKKYLAGDNKLNLERDTYYTSIFAAYGITDNLDLNFSLPYIINDNNKNLQDVSFYLKYRFKRASKGNVEFSVVGGLSTPISDYKIGGLNDIGQQATIIETRGLVHYICNNGWFGTLQSGFSFKLEEVPNSLPATLKLGRATSNWYYDVYYDYQHSFGGIDYRGTPAPQNFREFGVDFHKIGGTLFKPFSPSFGSYISVAYTFEGRNTFVGASYGFGLSYNFKVD
jgi:hypothetical protein